jgi:hypothetical protein
LRIEAGVAAPVFASRKGDALAERDVHDIARRAAAAAGINAPVRREGVDP